MGTMTGPGSPEYTQMQAKQQIGQYQQMLKDGSWNQYGYSSPQDVQGRLAQTTNFLYPGMNIANQQSAPIAKPISPAANFQYRPANNYAQYNTTVPAIGYGRSPLAPFVPQMNAIAARPSASALLSGIARAAPIGSAPAAAPAAMASGGAVRGIGGGQEDNQLRKSKVGNFIIPADVVSHLGDGNTDEGHRRIQRAEAHIRYACGGSIGYANGGQIADPQAVPVALSPGEHEVPADVVSMLGKGSNRAGANQLHAMINHVRAHKAKKGLPPKAKSPLAYMDKYAIPQQSPLMA